LSGYHVPATDARLTDAMNGSYTPLT
jgi:hypothetical protein